MRGPFPLLTRKSVMLRYPVFISCWKTTRIKSFRHCDPEQQDSEDINYSMTRSIKKGPYVNERILKKIKGKKPADVGMIKVWDRASQIHPDMVGFTFGVHNGKDHIEVFVTEEMVGHRLGEFSPTKKFWRHGGKMQKELDQKKKEAEIAAAKAAKAA